MSRLTGLLLVWLSLLGAAAPALACATADSGDCCPQNLPSPCGDNPLGNAESIEVCCVAAPRPSSSAVSADINRVSRELHDHFGSADPPLITTHQMFGVECSHPPKPLGGTCNSACTDAALTYLTTGRLRL